MKTIWKYKIDVRKSAESPIQIDLPATHKIVMVGPEPDPSAYDNEQVCFWAAVDTEAVKEVCNFIVTGTGHPVPSNGQYVGSVVMTPYAWHLWRLL